MIPNLVEELPFAYVVDSELTDFVCSACMKRSPTPLSRCSKCKFSHYCGSRCQRSAWHDHKNECSFLIKVQPRVPSTMVRLISRIIMKLNVADSPVAFNGRRFGDLVTHEDDIKEDNEKSEFVITVAHILRDYIGEENLCTVPALTQIFGKVITNVFTISDEDLRTIGLGLYLGLSRLDHSCRPDAFVLFEGRKAILRSVEPDQLVYSDELRIAYCDLLERKAVRQKQLREQFYFECDCPRCTMDESV
ncbi:hypothetical protein AB6A40_005813 [Gnathostoma spinigerum]|uniref:MYND-type domain-containing protein n=1 Tax=Gnathostoma spinigerum TaxID=75299 RepID=A0ABD6ELS6_9BILA